MENPNTQEDCASIYLRVAHQWVLWSAATRRRFPSPRRVAANHQSLTSQSSGVSPFCRALTRAPETTPDASAPPLLIQGGSFNGSPPQMRRGGAPGDGVVLSRKCGNWRPLTSQRLKKRDQAPAFRNLEPLVRWCPCETWQWQPRRAPGGRPKVVRPCALGEASGHNVVFPGQSAVCQNFYSSFFLPVGNWLRIYLDTASHVSYH